MLNAVLLINIKTHESPRFKTTQNNRIGVFETVGLHIAHKMFPVFPGCLCKTVKCVGVGGEKRSRQGKSFIFDITDAGTGPSKRTGELEGGMWSFFFQEESSQRRRTRIVRIHGEDHNMSSLFQAFATDIQSIKKKRTFNGLQSHLRLKKKKKKP